MSRSQDKFVIRLPDGMRARIAEVAKEQKRSMNMEIICRLESSMEVDPDNQGSEIDIRRLQAALDDAQDANRLLREQNRALAKELGQSLPKHAHAQGASA
ncbi:Arc family DNA-binding protein [Stutzerimonas stutzeri]